MNDVKVFVPMAGLTAPLPGVRHVVGGTLAQRLATHPPPAARVARLRAPAARVS